MSSEANMTVGARIEQLMLHLGLSKAHFAARLPLDWAESVMEHPDRIVTLTLICPSPILLPAIAPIGSKTLVFSGDRGPFGGPVIQILKDIAGTKLVTLPEYTGALWDDVIADYTDKIGDTILSFLAEKGTEELKAVPPQTQLEGEVADITYRIRGSGPPLMLLPLALSSSQWEPLISRLGEYYCTITLGGPVLGIIPALEERAATVGYRNMFRNLVMEAGLKPGESVLEVGTGTGVLSRWLANQTRGENPIIGMDINSYLIGEAANLAQKAGFKKVIHFREGNGESLPFQDNTFDFSFSVTVLEEGDADQMISEMVRVTKTGGRIGAIVRAIDIPFFINLSLRSDLKKKAEDFPNGPVEKKGCADASLYRRFQQVGLIQVKASPQLVTYDLMSPMNLAHMINLTCNQLSQDEQSEWNNAMSVKEVENNFFISVPYHCVIGTKVVRR